MTAEESAAVRKRAIVGAGVYTGTTLEDLEEEGLTLAWATFIRTPPRRGRSASRSRSASDTPAQWRGLVLASRIPNC